MAAHIQSHINSSPLCAAHEHFNNTYTHREATKLSHSALVLDEQDLLLSGDQKTDDGVQSLWL